MFETKNKFLYLSLDDAFNRQDVRTKYIESLNVYVRVINYRICCLRLYLMTTFARSVINCDILGPPMTMFDGHEQSEDVFSYRKSRLLSIKP